MSERPTAEQLRELRAWADDVATTQQSAKPRTYRRALTTLALLDAYEATQRPVEPSAHRSEQAAHPADPLEGRRPWLEVGHNGDEPEAPQVEHECGDDCMPARNLHFRTAAPPANDVGARVTPPWTHRQALDALRALREACCDNDWAIKDLEQYVSERAELERRARELLLDIERRSRGCVAEDGEYCVIVSESKVDALAELLGTEES